MTAIRALVLLTIAIVGAGCSTQLALNRPTVLPDVFIAPEKLPDFKVAQAPALVEGRLRKTKCSGTNPDISKLGMATGLTSQPESSAGLYLDSGATLDGTKWFLVRAKDDPERTYCGITLVGVDGGTNVSVSNVRWKHMDQVKVAVESGDFFCKCKGLTR